MGKLLKVLDKWIFLDSILPMLAEVPSREAGVLMAMLGIFHNAMREHDKYGLNHTVLATRVRWRKTLAAGWQARAGEGRPRPVSPGSATAPQILPFLMPLVVESSLNGSQFAKFMKLVRKMLDHIDATQTKALRELENMQAERETLQVQGVVVVGKWCRRPQSWQGAH